MATAYALSGGTESRERAEAGSDESVSEQVSKNVFTTYVCRSLERGLPHPGDIAEAASLSAIALPANNYPIYDSLGSTIVDSGKLSALQIEGVRYACQKHLELLPSSQRAGFFIGDGAGVGKGRQVAGIILDNICRGRTRHVWVSTSQDLHVDAQRDISDLGMYVNVINNCQALDAATKVGGLSKDFQDGVLFVTYSTLVSPGRRGKTRLQQVLDWCGGDSFEGCLIFDECHRAKNFVPGKEASSTKVAASVMELQERMPKARVVYCSATGVSEVGNMAYMSRMGLWGAGTAFPDFQSFLDSMQKRGVSFLEMLAMEMKSEGKYVARGLSFKDAEFMACDCKLEKEQVEVYNASVHMWQRLRRDLADALELTGGPAEAWRVYWSAQQRFFKLLCVSIKVPTVVAEARAAIDSGMCVVIGLQSTGEAATDSLGLTPGEACGFVSSTKELLRRFVSAHFPTCRNVNAEKGLLQNGEQPWGPSTLPAVQAAGLEEPECVRLRAALLQDIDAMQLPTNFLDQLVDELGGPDRVAEMTGRRARIVRRSRRHPAEYQLRAKSDGDDLDSLNIAEKDAFVSGKKLVAIISDAASTGISLHAMLHCKNQRRRMHLTIELPWSADKAIQQLGRSHRSNQSSAPIYKLVTTNVGGESRFAAAVARRLQSLGALTRGDRRAASGVDLSDQNFDSPLGRQALRSLYDFIVTGSSSLPKGVSLRDICEGVDLEEAGVPELNRALLEGTNSQQVEAPEQHAALHRALHASLQLSVELMGIGSNVPRSDTVAEDTASVASKPGGAGASKDLGDVRRFLNRILGLNVHRQNLFFNYFCATLQAEVRIAKAEGRYSEGVSDLPAASITQACEPQVLWVDPHSGLQTMRNTLRVDRGVSFASAKQRLELEATPGDGSGFYCSRRPWFGRDLVLLAIARPGPDKAFAISRPNTGDSFFDMEALELREKYVLREASEVEALWEELYTDCLDQCIHRSQCHAGKACTQGRRITEVTILSGSIVRVWGVLEQVLKRHEHTLNKADRSMRVIRVSLADDGYLVGVRYKESLLPEVVAMLSAIQTYVAKAGINPGATNALLGGTAQQLEQQVSDIASRAGMLRSTQEPVTPINNKLRAKLFRPPRTLLNFFTAKNPRPGVNEPAAQRGTPPLPPAEPLPKQLPASEPFRPSAASNAPSAQHVAPRSAQPRVTAVNLADSAPSSPVFGTAEPARRDQGNVVYSIDDSLPGSPADDGSADGSGSALEHPAPHSSLAAAQAVPERNSHALACSSKRPAADGRATRQNTPASGEASVPEGAADEVLPVDSLAADDGPTAKRQCRAAQAPASLDHNNSSCRAGVTQENLRGKHVEVEEGAAASRLLPGGHSKSRSAGDVYTGSAQEVQSGRPDPESHAGALQSIMLMGFSQHKAEVALKVARGDPERAVNWLLSSG